MTQADRFLIRPDVDPGDTAAVEELAGDITAWVMRQRVRVGVVDTMEQLSTRLAVDMWSDLEQCARGEGKYPDPYQGFNVGAGNGRNQREGIVSLLQHFAMVRGAQVAIHEVFTDGRASESVTFAQFIEASTPGRSFNVRARII